MPRPHRRASLPVAICCALVAIGLLNTPTSYQTKLRTVGRDIASPAMRAVLASSNQLESIYSSLFEKTNPNVTDVDPTEPYQKREQKLLRRCRDLELRNAELAEKLASTKRWGSKSYQGEKGKPLLDTRLIEATVLNKNQQQMLKEEFLIDRGNTSGLRGSLWAVETDESETTIDQGTEQNIDVGQMALRGKTVVGRISSVGRWTSSIQPITAASFRCPVQLVSRSESGTQFGAKGQLEGTGGPLCRLKWISPQMSVSVGDMVFTDREHEGMTVPMYFGRVTKAELPSGALEWSIWVEPAAATIGSGTLQIVRRSINRSRILAQ